MTKWFKAKKYGWGWYPSTWQGWAITVGFVIVIFLITPKSHQADLSLVYFLKIALLVGSLLWICYKTGEKPKWRWGDKIK